MTRGRRTGLTQTEAGLLRAGLVASLRGDHSRFWAYGVQKVFKDTTGRSISWGTLFPALRRLEVMGHLTSEWSSPDPGKRPIRYYRLTESGKENASAATAPSTGGILLAATTRPGTP